MKLGAVILAAGAASRMGAAKMLLPYSNKTILEHIIQELKALHPNIIGLVTGKYTHQIQTSIDLSGVELLDFPHWESGMAASINFGMNALLAKEPGLDAIVFLVSDQPFIDSQLLFRMLDAFQSSGKGIASASYQGQNGTPVIFHRKYFEQISLLEGDKGAKRIVMENLDDLVTIAFPLGAMDIDTPGDYEQLKELLNKQDAN